MQETPASSFLCELRFDISLPFRAGAGQEAETRRFERAWRAELAAQRKTALAMPPAQAVAARFRIVGTEGRPELHRYLRARLAALPGSPTVLSEPAALREDWAGVQIWLSYPAADLPGLLRTSQTKVNAKVEKRLALKGPLRFRGHRP